MICKLFSNYTNKARKIPLLFHAQPICCSGNEQFDVNFQGNRSIRFSSIAGKNATYERRKGWKSYFPIDSIVLLQNIIIKLLFYTLWFHLACKQTYFPRGKLSKRELKLSTLNNPVLMIVTSCFVFLSWIASKKSQFSPGNCLVFSFQRFSCETGGKLLQSKERKPRRASWEKLFSRQKYC